MKLAVLALVISAAVAQAAPTVDIEVDRDRLAVSWSTLPDHELEPGGAIVPAALTAMSQGERAARLLKKTLDILQNIGVHLIS